MFKDIDKSRLARTGAVILALGLVAGSAMAGQGGDEFSSVYDTIVDWSQGTLGRIIALAMVLVGMVAGVVRQSIMAVVIGIAGGMALYNAPTVIEAIMTANPTVNVMGDELVQTLKGMVNGMY